MTYPTQHDGTGADVERPYDPQETIRSILFEASDAVHRLGLFTRNKQLTDEQLTKLANIADRIDVILSEQQRDDAA